METTEITIPESTELAAEATGALARAQALQVTTPETYIAAADLREKYTERSKAAESLLRPSIQDADKLHDKLLAALKRCSGGFVEGAKILKGKMIGYDEEQKRLARLEQIRLQAEADKKAERDRKELAAQLKKAGAKEEAAEVLAAPIQAARVVVQKSTPKVEGFSYRDNWKVEVIDITALLEGWKAGNVPAEAFLGDTVYLCSEAVRLKEAAIGKWPGVKVWNEKV